MDLLAAEITARTGRIRASITMLSRPSARHAVLYTHRRTCDARAEGKAGKTLARGGYGGNARGRTDHEQAYSCPGQ